MPKTNPHTVRKRKLISSKPIRLFVFTDAETQSTDPTDWISNQPLLLPLNLFDSQVKCQIECTVIRSIPNNANVSIPHGCWVRMENKKKGVDHYLNEVGGRYRSK